MSSDSETDVEATRKEVLAQLNAGGADNSKIKGKRDGALSKAASQVMRKEGLISKKSSMTSDALSIATCLCLVQLRMKKRMGWIQLWSFLVFVVFFTTMILLWFDISTIGQTNRILTNHISRIEYARGKFPTNITRSDDIIVYTEALITSLYEHPEFGFNPDTSDEEGDILSFFKLMHTVHVKREAAFVFPCSPPTWSKDRADVFVDLDTCYGFPQSFEKPRGKKGLFEDNTLDLSVGLNDTLANLRALLTSPGYLDESISSLSLSLWLYNGQTRYSSHLTARFSFNIFGMISFVPECITFRLYHYEKPQDYLVGTLQVCFLLTTLLFWINSALTITKLVKERGFAKGMLRYFRSLWVFVDWIVGGLGVSGMCFHLYYLVNRSSRNLLMNSEREFTAEWVPEVSRYFMGLSAMLVSWKMLQFFDFEPKMAMLTQTLKRAAPSLSFYFVSLFVIMAGYAVGAFIIMGGQGNDLFDTFADALQSCFRMTSGELALAQILPSLASNEVTKNAISLWYWTYILLVFFILLNMFIAIIVDSYMEVMMRGSAEGAKGSGNPNANRNGYHSKKNLWEGERGKGSGNQNANRNGYSGKMDVGEGGMEKGFGGGRDNGDSMGGLETRSDLGLDQAMARAVSQLSHTNVLTFVLEGIRVLKQTFFTFLLRRPNGTIPKIAEDYAYGFFVQRMNAGQKYIHVSELNERMTGAPGCPALIQWLRYHERKIRTPQEREEARIELRRSTNILSDLETVDGSEDGVIPDDISAKYARK